MMQDVASMITYLYKSYPLYSSVSKPILQLIPSSMDVSVVVLRYLASTMRFLQDQYSTTLMKTKAFQLLEKQLEDYKQQVLKGFSSKKPKYIVKQGMELLTALNQLIFDSHEYDVVTIVLSVVVFVKYFFYLLPFLFEFDMEETWYSSVVYSIYMNTLLGCCGWFCIRLFSYPVSMIHVILCMHLVGSNSLFFSLLPSIKKCISSLIHHSSILIFLYFFLIDLHASYYTLLSPQSTIVFCLCILLAEMYCHSIHSNHTPFILSFLSLFFLILFVLLMSFIPPQSQALDADVRFTIFSFGLLCGYTQRTLITNRSLFVFNLLYVLVFIYWIESTTHIYVWIPQLVLVITLYLLVDCYHLYRFSFFSPLFLLIVTPLLVLSLGPSSPMLFFIFYFHLANLFFHNWKVFTSPSPIYIHLSAFYIYVLFYYMMLINLQSFSLSSLHIDASFLFYHDLNLLYQGLSMYLNTYYVDFILIFILLLLSISQKKFLSHFIFISLFGVLINLLSCTVNMYHFAIWRLFLPHLLFMIMFYLGVFVISLFFF